MAPDETPADPEPTARGWEALDTAYGQLYPDQPDPVHLGSVLPRMLTGEALQGISVYRATEPEPHWHYLTYGLSDLYDDEPTADPAAASGHGLELSLRLADEHAPDPEAEPPRWPVDLLGNLGRYVADTGNALAPGQHLDTRGPIALERDTRLVALGFVADPDLETLATPNGRVEVVQVVGLTDDERRATTRWNVEGVLGLVTARWPKGVIHLERASVLDDPAASAAVDEGAARDGSSTGMLYVDELDWHTVPEGTVLRVGAAIVADLAQVLPSRIRHGRPFALVGPGKVVSWTPVERGGGVTVSDAELVVQASSEIVDEVFAGLRPARGRHACDVVPGLLGVEVTPSTIRDRDGNLVRTIG